MNCIDWTPLIIAGAWMLKGIGIGLCIYLGGKGIGAAFRA